MFLHAGMLGCDYVVSVCYICPVDSKEIYLKLNKTEKDAQEPRMKTSKNIDEIEVLKFKSMTKASKLASRMRQEVSQRVK